MLPPPAVVVSLLERSSLYQASHWLIRLQLEFYRHLLAWLWFKRRFWSKQREIFLVKRCWVEIFERKRDLRISHQLVHM